MDKLLSVIIPVYNVEKYLDRCIKSILAHDNTKLEILLVDDGSTDKSGKICDSYLNYNFIKVYHKKNGGLSDARNYGLLHATGKYIWFIDSDDYILINIEKIIEELSEDIDILCFDYIMTNDNGNIVYTYKTLHENVSYTGEEYLKIVLKAHNYYIPVWHNIFRRDFLLDNNLLFKKGIYHEDEQLMPYIYMQAGSIKYRREVVYNYVLRKGSISSGNNNEKNYRDLFLIYNENKEYFEIHLFDPELRKLMLNDIVEKIIFTVCRYNVPNDFLISNLDLNFLKRSAIGIKNKIRVFLFVNFKKLYIRLFKIKYKGIL